MRESNTDKIHCTGCSACASACPKQCISMEADTEGFWYPKIEQKSCVNCGVCEKVCPVLHKRESASESPLAYAAFHPDEAVRLESSSGGMFSLLAAEMIRRGGVVFGAAFDSRLNAEHSYSKTEADLKRFRGSKYVQSRIGPSYEEARCFLESGRPVLFSGTPCQIAGLKSFLGKEYEGLICQDVVCHGVPSSKVWRKYLDFQQSAEQSKVEQAFFRDKTHGWVDFSLSLEFQNGKEHVQTLDSDLYMRAFLRNLSLRPSCYNCAFKMPYGQSDITLADFWGIRTVDAEMFDDRGVSLVLTHTEKGKCFFFQAAKEAVFREEDWRQALRFNPAAHRSAALPANRRAFFEKLDTEDFKALVSKYAAVPLREKIERAVKSRAKTALKRIGLSGAARKRK